MISLFDDQHVSTNPLRTEILRVYPDSTSKLWRIELGPWYEGALQPPSHNFQTKEKILLDKGGLGKFADEIQKILKSKPKKRVQLRIPFFANAPSLYFQMQYMKEETPLYFPELKGMFEFHPQVNVKYLTRAYGREEDEIYRTGWEGPINYIRIEQLQKFAADLDREANQE